MPKNISLKELAKHNKADDAWISIRGKVYDVTKFLQEHPGGEGILIGFAGGDVTDQFEAVMHSSAAMDLRKGLYIGDLATQSKL